MKKQLLIGTLFALVMVGSALAYHFDSETTWNTDQGTYVRDRDVSGTLGVGHDVESNWYKDGQYIGTLTQEVDWSAQNGCITRNSEVEVTKGSGGEKEFERTNTRC